MDSDSSNAEAVAAHHEAFLHALDEHYAKVDNSHVHIKSRAEYEGIIFISERSRT
jgi:hypothetical protein